MKLFAVVLALVATAAICADLLTDIRAGRIERWPTRLRQSVRLGRRAWLQRASSLPEEDYLLFLVARAGHGRYHMDIFPLVVWLG